MCIPIPDDVTDEQAVLADPFSVSLHAILHNPPPTRARPCSSTAAARSGCSPSRSCARSIRTVRVLAVARFPHQTRARASSSAPRASLPARPHDEIVERVAAETGAEIMHALVRPPDARHGGVDVVYDTVGSPEHGRGRRAHRRARAARIVVTGVEMPEALRVDAALLQGDRVIGSNAFGVEEFEGRRQHAMEMVPRVRAHRAHRRDADHHSPLPLEQYRDAFLACCDQGKSGAVKVLFSYPS